MRRRALFVLVVASVAAPLLVLSACTSSGDDASTVTLVTHDSFAVSKPVLRAFERRSGLHVRVLKSGDAGAALNQVILTKDAPLGDVFYGVDNTFLSRALAAGIFVPYEAKGLERVPADLQLDPRHRVTPIDVGDVCVNADTGWFRDHGVAVPSSLADLAKPAYRDALVVENPATSSPGLAFLLATIARYGDGWRDYWQSLRANGVKVVDGWEQAYSSDFSGAAGKGDRPLVVSYATSPPAEVLFAHPRPATAPTQALPDTCFRQIEFAGVLRGAAHPAAARKLVDFLLSGPFQTDIPLQMFVLPARAGTPLPSAFQRYAADPQHPFMLPAREIGAHRDEWINQWTATVLR